MMMVFQIDRLRQRMRIVRASQSKFSEEAKIADKYSFFPVHFYFAKNDGLDTIFLVCFTVTDFNAMNDTLSKNILKLACCR